MLALLSGTWFLLMAVGVPIAFCLGLASAVALYWQGGAGLLTQLVRKMTAGVQSFPLLAVPLFMLAGNLMEAGGATRRLVGLADVLVRRFAGGLAHVTIVTEMVVSGMSGSGLADLSAVGSVMIPAMRREGYPVRFAAGVTCAAATMGPIIPPSIPMVIYGVIAEVSVGGLFLGGVVPGLAMGLAMMALVALISRQRGYPRKPAPSRSEVLLALRHAFPSLMFPVIILGGILAGAFTPTEAAAVAALYALFLGVVCYREISVRSLPALFLATVESTAPVMLIVGAANAFSWILAREQVPQLAVSSLLGISQNPIVILLILNVFLLILGCFLESLAILIIVTPVIIPVLAQYGIDPLHFGVVMVLNVMIGALTPPFGLYLYFATGMTGDSFESIVRGTAPFLVPLIAVLFLITYLPGLVVYLPRLFLGTS
jgi:tripartite ATP-independent transporter DctM subunit